MVARADKGPVDTHSHLRARRRDARLRTLRDGEPFVHQNKQPQLPQYALNAQVLANHWELGAPMHIEMVARADQGPVDTLSHLCAVSTINARLGTERRSSINAM